MRKFLAALLAFVLLCVPALANASDYIQYGDTDEVIGELQSLLDVRETGRDDAPIFGDSTLLAVESFQCDYGLPVTGEFDPETLCALMGVYIDAYEDYYLVWIPMHGGTRYHCDDECSNMDGPRLVPWECADLLGFTPCKRCY